MFFYEGFSCPVCGKAFEETDDIVACPKCGAPHHRACWQAVGHCALTEAHDTAEQWSRETAKKADEPKSADEPKGTQEPETAWVCPACGANNLEYAEFCAKCGKQRQSAPQWQSAPQSPRPDYREYSPFHAAYPMRDPYGGVEHDAMIEEDVSASDAVAYTAVNSHYYLPRFRNIAAGNKFSWNWAAFLLYPYWLLYRKSFLAGFIVLGISLIQGVVRYQVAVRMLDMIGSGLTQIEMAERMQLLAVENETFRYLLIGLGLLGLIELILSLIMGICGNWIYQKTACARIRRFKEKQPHLYPQELSRFGGVSFVSGMLAYLCSDYIIQFFYMLFK